MKIYFNRYEKGYIASKRSRVTNDSQYEIICNKNKDDKGVYIETWLLEDGKFVDVRYNILHSNVSEINKLREKCAKEANSELAYIVSVKIPEEMYVHIERYMTIFPK